MRSMVEGAIPRAVRGPAPSTAFGGPPPPSLRDGGGLRSSKTIPSRGARETRYPPVPSARGASGGVRERGGIGSSEAGSPVEEVRGAKVGDRGSRRRPSVDAVLGRSLATVGPGSSASRVRRARGRVPRHPGGGLARPGEKPGSVRTHLRRWRPATDGRHNCRSREARDQERRAGGLVRLRQRRVAFLPHPSRARPPGREHGPGLPLPSGTADAPRSSPRAEAAAGTKARP